ncbi:MAG: hypothetical protein ACE5KX_00395 [Acidimicrobiia bacterium]
MTYQFDPEAAPDSDFEPGELHHLVVGNRGRLLDPRRTPIQIVALHAEIGIFELEVTAFEDKGAHWEIPFEEIGKFQVERESPPAGAEALRTYREAVRRLDRPFAIPSDGEQAQRSREALSTQRKEIRKWLSAHSRFVAESAGLDLSRREGEPALYRDLGAFMESQDLTDLENDFATLYVSNPGSGELIKGHRIVLAEMGLSPYEGKVIRDQTLFDEPWTRERRAAHILARMGFVQEVFAWAGYDRVVLYRAMTGEGPLRPARPQSFVSATFSRQVAESLFDARKDTNTAVMWRQAVPLDRLFMTYIETEQMNRRFKEAEAVLLADPDNSAF